MRAGRDGVATAQARPGVRFADLVELTKPRITSLVVVTTAVGFLLGSGRVVDPVLFLHALLGTALVAAGTSALNQYAEREADGRMLRTRGRPLPAGRVDPASALLFAVAVSLAGIAHLALTVSLETAALAAATLLSYLFVYTPLKRSTSLCTLVGAVPGAIPPLMGFTAARGGLGTGGLLLFAILFVWQVPHSLAIAWMYREDYARGGFSILPVLDPDGGSTGRQVLAHALVLLPVSLAPTVLGVTGAPYFYGALLLGLAILATALAFAATRSARAARRLLLASVIYLPALLLLMALDRVPPLP